MNTNEEPPITVKQLIKALQQLDPNAMVLVDNDRDFRGRSPLGRVESDTISMNGETVEIVTMWSDDGEMPK